APVRRPTETMVATAQRMTPVVAAAARDRPAAMPLAALVAQVARDTTLQRSGLARLVAVAVAVVRPPVARQRLAAALARLVTLRTPRQTLAAAAAAAAMALPAIRTAATEVRVWLLSR